MTHHGIGHSAGNYSYSADIYTNAHQQPHFHTGYELIYAFDGQAAVSVGGESQILYQGELLLIPPYTVHRISAGERDKTWIGVFSEEFIMSFAQKWQNELFSAFSCDGQIEKILQKYLFVEGEPEHFMLMSCLYMVCNECEKNAKVIERKIDRAFMNSAIEYVSENLSDEVSLREMAEMLGYEYHYASMLFNDCFGMNFKSFLNMLRYDAACRQLLDKSKDITSIAELCGFGSVRNFNRVFKSMSGMTPREYRSK